MGGEHRFGWSGGHPPQLGRHVGGARMTTYAGQWGPEAIINSAGRAQPSAAVTLYESDGTTLATRYTSRTKAATASNPWTADARGNVSFFADPAAYVLSVNIDGAVTTLPITVDMDPAEAATDTDVARRSVVSALFLGG